MEENLFACFSSYARGAQDASVQRLAGVGVAVVPQPPANIVYNNAVLARGLGRRAAAAAIARTEDSYAGAGVVRYAIWIHDAEAPSIEAVEAAGLEVDMTTRAMAMPLDALPP